MAFTSRAALSLFGIKDGSNLSDLVETFSRIPSTEYNHSAFDNIIVDKLPRAFQDTIAAVLLGNVSYVNAKSGWKIVSLLVYGSLGLVLTSIAIGVVYLLSLCIYRIYFHPLSRFPGPSLAKVTTLYGAYHAWKGDLHIDMWRCHQKYGNYVRYGPDRVLFNTTKALKQIYGHNKQIRKAAGYQMLVHQAPNTFTAIDKKVHERKRRIVSQGFSDAALRSYENKIRKHVDIFLEQLVDDGHWQQSVDMGQIAGNFAFDSMTDITFGLAYHLQTQPDFRHVPSCIELSNVRTGVMAQAPIVAFRRWDRKLFRPSILARNRFIKFVAKLLEDRMAKTKHEQQTQSETQGRDGRLRGEDVFSLLLGAKDEETGQSLSAQELAGEATTLIVAGSDTTATTLSAVFFYLSRNPPAYLRAVTEVRSAFQSSTPPTLGPLLNSCTYLRACVDEALRMSPPVGSALWREVLPATMPKSAGSNDDGLTIDGFVIPPGVEVGTAIYAIQHSEEYYQDPFTYRPERWLAPNSKSEIITPAEPTLGAPTTNVVETTTESIELARSAFNPFSIGPRGCVGKPLALNQVMLALATILLRLEFRTATGAVESKVGEGGGECAEWGRHRREEYQMRDYVTAARNGPWVQFRKI